MGDSKDDRPDDEYSSINDSGELLKSLFREELNAIAAEKKKIMAAQTGDKSTAPKTAKSPAQNKGAGRKKAGLPNCLPVRATRNTTPTINSC